MIKLLAKLRQYKDGDVAEYLKTEHRQNLIAIENAFGGSSSTSESTLQSGTICFVGCDNVTPASIFSGSPPYYHTGDVVFYDRKTLVGSDVSNGWVCSEAGNYLVEVSHACTVSTSSTTTKNMYLQIGGVTSSTITDVGSNFLIKAFEPSVKFLVNLEKGQLVSLHKPDSEKLLSVFMTKISLKITKV